MQVIWKWPPAGATIQPYLNQRQEEVAMHGPLVHLPLRATPLHACHESTAFWHAAFSRVRAENTAFSTTIILEYALSLQGAITVCTL
jgi:hypothetical protein